MITSQYLQNYFTGNDAALQPSHGFLEYIWMKISENPCNLKTVPL